MTTLTSSAAGVVLLASLSYVLFKLAVFATSYLRSRRMLRKFPTDASSFNIFGHLFDYPGPNEAGLLYQRDHVAKFPITSIMWLMNIPMLLVSHPTTVSVILRSSEPKGPLVYNLFRPWIGDGILTSKDEKWYRNRRLLTPAFHFEILKNYVEIKNRCADMLVVWNN
ncbi:cytochrome p450 [Plakobranchus ocellatus]|uniref:Cytochrome p450 n=1 Tax=Plakobranchus ocellatus TaxID=259542 RepID=A0AAV4C3I0_9GAST|nr:cytochrome p450 [Plakobranchus ocellatus]